MPVIDPTVFSFALSDIEDALRDLQAYCEAHPEGQRQDRLDAPLGRFISRTDGALAEVRRVTRLELYQRYIERRRKTKGA